MHTGIAEHILLFQVYMTAGVTLPSQEAEVTAARETQWRTVVSTSIKHSLVHG